MKRNTRTLLVSTAATLAAAVGLSILAGWVNERRTAHSSGRETVLVESLRNYLEANESLVCGMVSLKETGRAGSPVTLMMNRPGGYKGIWSDIYTFRATVLPEGLMQTAALTYFLDRKYIKPGDPVPMADGDAITVREGFLRSSRQSAEWMAIGSDTRYYDARSFFQSRFDDYFGSSESCYVPEDKFRSKEVAASIADGTGVLLSQDQFLTFFDSIANGGVRARNRYFRKRRICREETARQMAALLRENVTEGTGAVLAGHPLRIAGKTGSGMMEFGYVPGKGTVSAKDSVTVASFAGFFPADDPKYTMCVTLFSDTPGCTPGIGAMDLFGQIATMINENDGLWAK